MGGQEGVPVTSSKPNSKQMKSDQRTMGPVRAVTVCDVTSGVVRVTISGVPLADRAGSPSSRVGSQSLPLMSRRSRRARSSNRPSAAP